MRARFLALLLGIGRAATAIGLESAQDKSATTQPRDTLRVLVWNIQRGANGFDHGPEKARDILREAAPDVCLLQESYEIDGPRPQLGVWIAGELGWNAHQDISPHLCVLTPLEIRARLMHLPWHGVGVRVRDRAGRELVAYTTWIDYREYLPYQLRDKPDVSDAELLANETQRSARLSQTQALLVHLDDEGLLNAEVPLLVGGDWNCPSHLDWTEETARVFRFRRALRLPVSLAVAERGLVDTFRVIYPNPVQHPGISWSPLYLGTLEKPETADRIDRLYLRNPSRGLRLTPVRAQVLPEKWEDASVPEGKRGFPSDHCAVIIDLRWEGPGSASAPTTQPRE